MKQGMRLLMVVAGLALAQSALALGTETYTPTCTPSMTPSPTVTMTAVCGSTFGCMTCTAHLGANSLVSELILSQFNLGESGTANIVSVYLTGTSGARIRAGIYLDNSDMPGGLLVESEETTTSEGWNVLPINPTYLPAGKYWIAALSEPNRLVWSTSTSNSDKILDLSFAYGHLPTFVPSGIIGTGFSFLMYASYCPGPPIFLTPTPTLTATPTPIQYNATSNGKLALGPVPAKRGTPVCLYFDQAPSSSSWEVFNVRGQRVSSLSFGLGEQACWDTTQIAPGIYIARAKVIYAGGGSGDLTQKVVVLP